MMLSHKLNIQIVKIKKTIKNYSKLKKKNFKDLKYITLICDYKKTLEFLIENQFINTINYSNFTGVTIKYIMNIIFLLKNTKLNFISSKGLIEKSATAGTIGLKGKQKHKQPFAILKILKIFSTIIKDIIKKKFNISIRFNIKKYFNLNILNITIKALKKFFFLRSDINIYILNSHNGCRPRKLRNARK